MSSYVTEYQSRGIGAIASHDLGVTAKTAGTLSLSRAQTVEAARKPANTLSTYGGVKATAIPGPTLTARDVRGGTPSSFTPGATGAPLSLTPQLVEFAVRGERYPILSRPGYGVLHAGIMPGSPPATLMSAEEDREEAELFVPDMETKIPWLWILGAAAATWFVTRKR